MILSQHFQSNMVETRSQKKAKEEANGSTTDNGQVDKNESLAPSEKLDNGDVKAAHHDPPKTSMLTIVFSVIVVAVSILTMPESLQPVGRPSINHVWYFGWISALSTGLGVLPLVFSPDLNTWWIGVTNGELPSTSL